MEPELSNMRMYEVITIEPILFAYLSAGIKWISIGGYD
jgi:hypothetical protein